MNSYAVILKWTGRIDSGNAQSVESESLSRLSGSAGSDVVIDASGLDYISSAGLRVILRLKKNCPGIKITNVSPEVYDILEMTGFTEILTVEKAYRVVSVDGCEVIGEGFNGKVYRIDGDNVVKTYKNADALSEIQREREIAKLALILGVPTAISYDVVKVGDSYGSVFELLDARSFAKILAEEPERTDWCISEYVKMLKTVHGITVPEGKLPPASAKIRAAASRIKGILPDGLGEKLSGLIDAIPGSDHLIHGDFHTKNIVVSGGEVLVIDMDTLSVGNPVFEFLNMYNAYIGYSEYDPGVVLAFQGYDQETARRFWLGTLKEYLGTEDDAVVEREEEKIRVLSYTYLIDWSIRHYGDGDAETRAARQLWTDRLVSILPHVDSLVLDVSPGAADGSLRVAATTDRLDEVTGYVNSRLDAAGCPPKAKMQIDLAVEEIFVNIANYAYSPGSGDATVTVAFEDAPRAAVITFSDSGKRFDPLSMKDPDVTLPASERGIGGLGVFLTKKVTDSVTYEYRDGRNVLTMKKIF